MDEHPPTDGQKQKSRSGNRPQASETAPLRNRLDQDEHKREGPPMTSLNTAKTSSSRKQPSKALDRYSGSNSPKFELTPQAAALAWSHNELQGLVICIVSARSGGWTLPKGHIDDGHEPHQSAAIEAYEEAGLLGVVHPEPIGEYHYIKSSGKPCRVEVFRMRVTSVLAAWDEQHARQRAWIEPAEAEHWIDHPQSANIITQFSDELHRLVRATRND